jgi:hypothetical protein
VAEDHDGRSNVSERMTWTDDRACAALHSGEGSVVGAVRIRLTVQQVRTLLSSEHRLVDITRGQFPKPRQNRYWWRIVQHCLEPLILCG